MNFSSRVTKKLCPYLKNSTVREEAASTAYSLPDAMKQCPYVKDLYSGFGVEDQKDTNNLESSPRKLGIIPSSSNQPKLFKMEQSETSCECKDFYADEKKAECPMKSSEEISESNPTQYDHKFDDAITQLKDEGRYRKFINVERHMGSFPRATRREQKDKSEVVVWCSNDYLGMGQHPKVLTAMHNAIDNSGAGSGGTRNIGGNTKYIEELENEVAQLHGKEKGLIFSSCYVANETTLTTLPQILGPDTIYFSDSKNHASLIHGMRNGRCDRKVFRHNDVEHLEELLKETDISRPKIIVFESVYSMCGTVGPIKEIVELAEKYDALCFLDEVHAVGLYGPSGAGVAELIESHSDRVMISGTLGKGFGVYGGYVTGNANLIDVVRSNGAGFIFTTSLPPTVLAGAKASINHLRTSQKERSKHRYNTSTLLGKLIDQNLPVMKSDSHILPLFIGNPVMARTASDMLLDEFNIYVQPINYPTVPKGEERLRISPSPLHTEQMMDDFAGAAREVWTNLGLKLLDDYLVEPEMHEKFFLPAKKGKKIDIGDNHLYTYMDSLIL